METHLTLIWPRFQMSENGQKNLEYKCEAKYEAKPLEYRNKPALPKYQNNLLCKVKHDEFC